ncbi:MAG TPA: uroporphyrinogen-III C-methyltransferase [Acidimicrobiales bacterium]|nr:uroporphyrinogen-III C-methyltransferase [Acidimicrobiales bacterium]
MTVYLVGAGPGDPGLLTVRGAEVLASADVVVYDRLSIAGLLDLAPAHAERIGVGKAPGRVTMAQEAINELLVHRGRAGQQVVRLKGGDPFVFARGAEEAAALAAAGVAFEIVPGITSAIAAPAYAGIPVTRRHSSTSFTVVTGHEDPSRAGPEGSVDWEAVSRVGGTIVILMGVGRWPRIAERLLAAGRPPDTPAAAVRWGTRPEQHTVRATLATLAEHDLESPSVIVVGEVAAIDLDWFTSRPLFGRRVVVTRSRAQASVLSARLRELGADVIEVPAIEIGPPDDGGAALRSAVAQLAPGAGPARFDWVVFTSANGVHRTFEEIPDARLLGGVQVAAIGSETAAALARYRVLPDLVPDRFVAEGLLAVFPPAPAAGGRILLPRAAVARDVLPDGLRARGWDVHVVDAYRTVPGRPDPSALAAASTADAVCFTSSSTVTNYLTVAGTRGASAQVSPVVVAIGPITAATARDAGLQVDAVAEPHTIDGLVDALVGALTRDASVGPPV